jgi:hypothetical protein
MTKEKGATSLSRREFLKGAAIAGAATASAAALSGCGGQAAEGKPVWMPDAWDAETDVIIVGTGGAGLSAAITLATENLGSAIILEAAPEGQEGGNTRVSSQIMLIPKDVAGAVKYQSNLNGVYEVEPELLEVWATELMNNTDWLNDLGAELGPLPVLSPEFTEVEGGESIQTYGVRGTEGIGNAVCWNLLRSTADDNNVDIRFDSRVTNLVFNPETKEVLGVKTDDGRVFKAKKGVILACGGFENNPELLRTYYSSGYPEMGFCGTPYNRGDGIYMAQQVGAKLWHMNNFAGPYLSTKTMAKDALPGDLANSNLVFYNPMFYAKDYIFVGCDGKRYMNEDAYLQCRHGKIWQGGTYVTMPTPTPGWCILGPKVFAAGDLYGVEGGMNKSAWTGVFGLNKAITNQSAVDNGVFIKCESAADVAKAVGVSVDVIQKTIDDWNASCASGLDAPYHRGEDYFNPTSASEKPTIAAYPIERLDPPYYVFSLIGGLLNSQGGPKRNVNAEIVDLDEKAIPRLFGAGELGCIYSYEYNGGGNVSEAIASGRFAARNVAKLTAWDAEADA